jgi:hypothetical protein
MYIFTELNQQKFSTYVESQIQGTIDVEQINER